MLKIKLIPAEYGECVIVSIGELDRYHILIDGGLAKTYQDYIAPELRHLKALGQKINLMVCTHMDLDHISGLVQTLRHTPPGLIENVWYNGFLQVISGKFYSQKENKFTDRDNNILGTIISQGTLPGAGQEVGINEGMSLGVLIEDRNIPLNAISKGQAICPELAGGRKEIKENIFVTVLGPSRRNIMEVEDFWKKDMVSRNYMFRVSDKIKLTEAFEYQIERIKSLYSGERFEISGNEDLKKYIGDLRETDDSIVNRNSISFILECGNKKFLFLGDAVTDESILNNIEKAVGFNHRFSAIKLPHHGSRYNITHEFIRRYTADEYYCLTNSKKYGHPDLEALAAIVCHNPEFKRVVFNYPVDKAGFLDKKEWKERYHYEVIAGDGRTVMERVF